MRTPDALALEPSTPDPLREDTVENLEAKHAEANRAVDDAQRTLDLQRGIREELRVALAYKRGTCLCEGQRHASCQGRRPWCTVNNCSCDTCLARSANG